MLAQLGGVAKPCLVKTGPKQRELSQEARPAQQKRRRYLTSDSKGEGTVASVACVQSAMQSTFAREGFLDLRADSATPPSFSLLALGTGGGPVEDNLSAYWVKPASSPWSKGFVSIDGGEELRPCFDKARLIESTQDPALEHSQDYLKAIKMHSWTLTCLRQHRQVLLRKLATSTAYSPAFS